MRFTLSTILDFLTPAANADTIRYELLIF